MSRIFFALFLLAATALAGKPEGFLGIQWGASPEEAKRIMQARPGVKFPEDTDDYRFELTGGTFAGQPVAKWTLEFPERKFASAVVVIKTEGDPQSMYKDFRAQLVAKYGNATTNQKLSIKAPRGTYPRPSSFGTVSTWKFSPNLKDKSAITIACEMAGPDGGPTSNPAQLQVVLRYTNESLTTAAAENMVSTDKPVAVGVKKDEL